MTNIPLTWFRRCRSLAAVWILAIGFVGCSSDSLTSPTSPAQLDGTWRLFEMTDPAGVHREDLNAGRFNVTFAPSVVQVRADCNTCTGATELSGSTLIISNLACTRAACGSTPLDTRFTAILDGTLTVRLNNRLLQLNATGSPSELRFEK